LPEGAADAYLGTYAFPGCGDDPLVVERNEKGGGLGIKRSSGTIRRLHRKSEHTFSLVGAPHVTFRFSVSADRATGLTIHRKRPVLAAKRIGA